MNTSIPKTSGIYKITCIPTGKIYVGSAISLFHRWNKHRSELRNNKHFNPHLQNAWNKYGESAFTFEVLELVMPWSRIDREQYWLDTLKSYDRKIGFNVGKVADNGMAGRTHTSDARAKQSAKAKGRKHSLKSRKQMSISHKGVAKSEAHKAKISAAHMGIKQSPEILNRIADALSKNYIVTDPNGNETIIRNLNQFCKDNGLSQGHMSEVASGKQSHHRGWKCRRDKED